jgi:[ribosomal protein S5]-alanine N-acetyltransferase
MSEENLSVGLDLKSIYLKQLNQDDVTDDYVGWLNDPEITKYLEIRHTTQPFTTDTVKNFVAQCHKDHRHHWGIFVHNKHVGNVSCSLYNYANNSVDVSILVGDRTYWGKNLGRIAVGAATNHLFTVSGFNCIQSGAYSVHVACINLFSKLGFRKEAVLKDVAIIEGQLVDVVKFGLLKSEWSGEKMTSPMVSVYAPPWEYSPP